jgi:hypothetical protein
MPTIFIRWMLFISSYFPLTLIIWILFITQNPRLAWISLIIGTIGLTFTILYFIISLKASPIQVKIIERQEKEGDVMGYIASYIIPLVTLPLNGWQQIFTLLIFTFVLGIIYTNSSMIRINPMLSLRGYRLYEIMVENSTDTYSLLSLNNIKKGDNILIVVVGRGIYLEKSYARKRLNRKG